jgi:hypothetical protein
MMQKFSSSFLPVVLSHDEYDALRSDAQDKGNEVIEFLTASEEPLAASGNGEGLGWESETSFSLQRVKEFEDFSHVLLNGEVSSKGMIENFDQHSRSHLEIGADVFLGFVPLPVFSFLLSGEWDVEQKEEFLSQNEVNIIPVEKSLLPSHILFAAENILSKKADTQLKKALKLKVFDSSDLTVQQIREALGLEISEEPVKEGVYLIEDDLGLGGVYVQGDIDRMVLSIEESYQVVSFEAEHGRWELKFSPSLSKTIFTTPDDNSQFDLIPLGIIIVDGKIASLSAQDKGASLMVQDEEPCLLQGINLTLISPDSITISSSLRYQGVTWKDQIPYLKDNDTQLNIFATGKDLVGDTEREGRIAIARNAPDTLSIHGALTASGEGFTVEGGEKTIHILGGIQSTACHASGCTFKVVSDQRYSEDMYHMRNSPPSIQPVFFLSSLKLVGWKDE